MSTELPENLTATPSAPIVTAPIDTAPIDTAPIDTAPIVTAPIVTAPIKALEDVVKDPVGSIGDALGGPKDAPNPLSWFGDMKNALGEILANKKGAFHHFHNSFWFLKGFGTIFLLGLMVWNLVKFKNVGLVASKPGMFILESFVFSICTVIPFAILSYMRNTVNSEATTMMILGALFVGFFILNFVLEMSGIYAAIFDEEKKTDKPVEAVGAAISATEKVMGNAQSIVNWSMILTFAVPLLICVGAAFLVRNTTPHYQHIVSDDSPVWQQILVFLLETGVFAVINAVPVFLVAYNRNALSSHTATEFGLITAKFSALHIILQLTGFYGDSFNGKFD